MYKFDSGSAECWRYRKCRSANFTIWRLYVTSFDCADWLLIQLFVIDLVSDSHRSWLMQSPFDSKLFRNDLFFFDSTLTVIFNKYILFYTSNIAIRPMNVSVGKISVCLPIIVKLLQSALVILRLIQEWFLTKSSWIWIDSFLIPGFSFDSILRFSQRRINIQSAFETKEYNAWPSMHTNSTKNIIPNKQLHRCRWNLYTGGWEVVVNYTVKRIVPDLAWAKDGWHL